MNPNEKVWIKPTEAGWRKIRAEHEKRNKIFKKKGLSFSSDPPTPCPKGYIGDQFWCLMRYFDWKQGCGDVNFSDMQLEEP